MYANLYVLCLYISMLCYTFYIFTGIGPVTMTFMLLLVLELHDHNFLNTAVIRVYAIINVSICL